MSDQTAIRAMPQPFRFEAMEYCDEHGIDDMDTMERVRLSMAQREFMARMEPWQKTMAGLLAMCVPGSTQFAAQLELLHETSRELQQMYARELGIELQPTDDKSPAPAATGQDGAK